MRLRALTRALMLAATLSLLCACTVRHSQIMVGRIVRPQSAPTRSMDQGLDFAIGGFFRSGGGVTITEPQSLLQQAESSCEAVLAQADYRSTWFIIPLLVNPTVIYPEVTLTSYCMQ